MSEQNPLTGADLIAGIVKGQVPRQVRLFAAQGLLPISREELLSLQCVLSSDPDEELAKAAANSVRDQELTTILDWLRDHPPESLVLDQLIRVRDEEAIWATVASHPNVSDETLRVIARNATPMVQDIIITNQVRVLGCLEILDDLRANAQVNQVVLRRVREFEEEFIQKVLAEEEAAAKAGPSVEEAIEALHAIGAHIPKEISMPYPLTEDEELAEAIRKAGESVHSRLLMMSVHERIICALRGTREERALLINSRNRLIQRSVLACPYIRVRRTLVVCPHTPLPLALSVLVQLSVAELRRALENPDLSEDVRDAAQSLLEREASGQRRVIDFTGDDSDGGCAQPPEGFR